MPRSIKSTIASLAALAFVILTGSSMALAGSYAQTISETSLRLGPGVKYNIVSDMEAGVAVDVERCHRRWCLIASSGHKGWTSIDELTFGEEPRGPFSGPKNEQVSYGTGTICFHTGVDFSGEAVCSKTGMLVPDLALYGYDNTFASVSVTGEISANVCREFNFGSYCETIAADQPRLSPLLRDNVSSYRVW